MKIRQFLVKLDEIRTTYHFPFILRFRLEHGRLKSASIFINFLPFFLADFGGCSSATCNPDQVDPITQTVWQ
ncbi:calcium-transporting ATPase 12 [Pyrus ussuriensis x Pyrus communis]|uniref:Calcium-transporting ATPase 12 n=1 Tax=Pyrus ussuriensis x Pyrus communis TaxID=2448454 RepID=A0A5N5FPE2_9ROSA|nr:calcium-transporting ATPase 12 [Pyrus ussuriensis x Pyrus communis]